jgi:hypothetical protein
MAIKINYQGIEVTLPSTGEAADLLRKLTETTPPKTGPRIGRPPKIPENIQLFEATPSRVQILTNNFLMAIASADADGPTTEEIMSAVDVTAGRGIGGRLVRINNFLLKAGLNPKDVYDNRKTSEGRVWRAGPRLIDAIQVIKEGVQ